MARANFSNGGRFAWLPPKQYEFFLEQPLYLHMSGGHPGEKHHREFADYLPDLLIEPGLALRF